jgi:hypothetical protein
MCDRNTLATIADISAYIDEAIAQAERGQTTFRHAASRIVGLAALDAYYAVWVPQCDALDDVHSVAGIIEGAAVASDHWRELCAAATRLRTAARGTTSE